MTGTIGRRNFVAALGCATIAPLAANAQRARWPVVGYLSPFQSPAAEDLVRRPVAVIVATSGINPPLAAKAATRVDDTPSQSPRFRLQPNLIFLKYILIPREGRKMGLQG